MTVRSNQLKNSLAGSQCYQMSCDEAVICCPTSSRLNMSTSSQFMGLVGYLS